MDPPGVSGPVIADYDGFQCQEFTVKWCIPCRVSVVLTLCYHRAEHKTSSNHSKSWFRVGVHVLFLFLFLFNFVFWSFSTDHLRQQHRLQHSFPWRRERRDSRWFWDLHAEEIQPKLRRHLCLRYRTNCYVVLLQMTIAVVDAVMMMVTVMMTSLLVSWFVFWAQSAAKN